MKNRIVIIALVVLLVVGTGSGWIVNSIKNRTATQTRELESLTTTFNRQYGTEGIEVSRLLASEKIYTIVWKSKDGITHVSWNVGGLWVEVFKSQPDTSESEK